MNYIDEDDLKRVMKNHLKFEEQNITIEQLLSKRYQKKISHPYFKRDYLWNEEDSNYFIDSILNGMTISPFVFFDNGLKLELIDGKQRYKTLQNFIKKNINSKLLEKEIMIYEFTIINEPKIEPQIEDRVKKEIFKRYNTSLVNHNISISTKEELKKVETFFIQLEELKNYSYSKNIDIEDTPKASFFIESLLLNICPPPLIVEKNKIIDANARVKIILDFIDGKFALKKVKILNELKGEYFNTIPINYQDKLLNSSFKAIEFQEAKEIYNHINYRPYKIKEHTFEAWNYTIDKEIIESIHLLKEKFKSTLFKEEDKRMQTEEKLIKLVFANYNKENIPLENKKITKLLEAITNNEKKRKEFLKNIKKVEKDLQRLSN